MRGYHCEHIHCHTHAIPVVTMKRDPYAVPHPMRTGFTPCICNNILISAMNAQKILADFGGLDYIR